MSGRILRGTLETCISLSWTKCSVKQKVEREPKELQRQDFLDPESPEKNCVSTFGPITKTAYEDAGDPNAGHVFKVYVQKICEPEASPESRTPPLGISCLLGLI